MWYYANSEAEAEALEVPAFLSCGHIFLAGDCIFFLLKWYTHLALWLCYGAAGSPELWASQLGK